MLPWLLLNGNSNLEPHSSQPLRALTCCTCFAPGLQVEEAEGTGDSVLPKPSEMLATLNSPRLWLQRWTVQARRGKGRPAGWVHLPPSSNHQGRSTGCRGWRRLWVGWPKALTPTPAPLQCCFCQGQNPALGSVTLSAPALKKGLLSLAAGLPGSHY